jgi:hypothetical protein
VIFSKNLQHPALPALCEILEASCPDASTLCETSRVEVVFKDGTRKVFEGPNLPELRAILNH